MEVVESAAWAETLALGTAASAADGEAVGHREAGGAKHES
jgi:hypothetical protein